MTLSTDQFEELVSEVRVSTAEIIADQISDHYKDHVWVREQREYQDRKKLRWEKIRDELAVWGLRGVILAVAAGLWFYLTGGVPEG